jgi:hypothetical protein
LPACRTAGDIQATPTPKTAPPVVQGHCPQKTKAQCREIIRTWLRTGTLSSEEYYDPVDRKTVEGLRVDAVKRPGTETAQT